MSASRKNTRVVVVLTSVVAGMIGLSYASVPLYRLFCQVTGYGGTTQVADSLPDTISERLVTIRFDAEVNPALPWAFKPEQKSMTLHMGEQGLAFYRATNRGDRPVVGTATFNVTPQKAGSYFNKIECFCFTEQRLEPGQTVDMPVTFFVDPAMAEDIDTREIGTVTLSYTFFLAPDQDAALARTAGVQLSAFDDAAAR